MFLFNSIRSGASALLRSLFKLGGFFGNIFRRAGAGGYGIGIGGYPYGGTAEEVYWGYYNGDIFQPLNYGGIREYINDSMGALRSADLDGHFNPVKRAVNCYRNVYLGSLGTEILVEPEYDGEVISETLQEAIHQVWRASKFDQAKQEYTDFSAGMGRAGLRIVAEDAEPDEFGVMKPPVVRIEVDDPRRIRSIKLDRQDNVEWVDLEYLVNEAGPSVNGVSDGTSPSDMHTIREVLTDREFVKYRDGALVSRTPNELGFCPYVLNRHEPITGPGSGSLPCFYAALSALNRINGVISNLNRHIQNSARTRWLIGAAGDPPTGGVDLGGDMTAIYVKTSMESPTPFMQAIVPKIAIADAVALVQIQIDEIRDRLPELKATDGKFLSNQSGATVAELREAAASLIITARTRYDDSLIRAIKMALSWGVYLKMWNLGSGMGTPEAADRSFRSGEEDFKFNVRPALPITEIAKTGQQLQEAQRWQALSAAATALAPIMGMELVRTKVLGLSEAEDEQAKKDSTQEDVQQVFPESQGAGDLKALDSGGKKKSEAA